MRTTIVFALTLALVAGCRGDDQETPEPINTNRARILGSLPVFPRSVLNDTTGSNEAERATYIVARPLDSVLAFYRDSMAALGWLLVNDNSDSLRGNLYLEKDSVTVWLNAQPFGDGSVYTLLVSAGLQTRGDTVRRVP